MFATSFTGVVEILAKSQVIIQDSMHSITDCSILFAKSISSLFLSNSPLFLSHQDQANILAVEFVEVCSHFKCL